MKRGRGREDIYLCFILATGLFRKNKHDLKGKKKKTKMRLEFRRRRRRKKERKKERNG